MKKSHVGWSKTVDRSLQMWLAITSIKWRRKRVVSTSILLKISPLRS